MQDFHLKAPKVNLSKNKTLDSNSTPIPNKDFLTATPFTHAFQKKKN